MELPFQKKAWKLPPAASATPVALPASLTP
jgi:hypothetical protein